MSSLRKIYFNDPMICKILNINIKHYDMIAK